MRLISKVLLIFLTLTFSASADARLDELPLNPAPLSTDSFYCVQGSTDYRCTLQQIQGTIGSNFSYFLTGTASDVGGYAVMVPDLIESVETTVAVAIPAADTLIKAWATIPTEPQFTLLIKGVYEFHIHAAKTAGTKSAVIYAELYKRSAVGVETLLITSEASEALTGVNAPYDLHGSLANDTALAVDDRLVLKIYGTPSGAGTTPTVTAYMEGLNTTRVEVKTTNAASDFRYLVKPGVAGGQVAYGGTGAGDDLALNSTTNATKGNINFGSLSTYDEVTDSWGIGDTTPTHQLDVNLRADDNILINGRTNPRAMTMGAMRFEHTPAMTGTRAITLDINSAGYADTHGLVMNYLATNHLAGYESHGFAFDIDTDNSTGGDFQAISVSKTGTGTLNVAGMETYSGVSPVVQKSGTPVAITTAFAYDVGYTDITTNINSAGSNSQIFVNDNNYLYIGMAAKFSELQVTLATPANVSIHPVFEYSTGAGSWATVGAADGTNGFQQNGAILWDADIAGWVTDTVNAVSGRYWLRIQRTRNTVATPPTESIAKVVTAVEHYWDASGNMYVNKINTADGVMVGSASAPVNKLDVEGGMAVGATYSGSSAAPTNGMIVEGNVGIGVASPVSYPLTVRLDGAGGQNVLGLMNLQAVAANVGSQLLFIGTGAAAMGYVRGAWEASATTEGYLSFFTRVAGAGTEKLRITSGGNLGLGVSAAGTSATKTFIVGTGTAPASNPADSFQMYSADVVAGNAAPHFQTELGNVIKLFKGAALTAADAGVVDGTWDATEAAVVNNMRTRINEIEARLQALGLLN